jgi:indole-3-glycerol phosphate synthase
MNILDEIVAYKHTEVADHSDPHGVSYCVRDFDNLFRRRPFLIAELKACSPSEGQIAGEDYMPLVQANAYIKGGADMISVLTDEAFFGGAFDIIQGVRALGDIPILCKDFIIDIKQIHLARSMGADFVLLIVKILSDEWLRSFKEEIERWGMRALIEVQNDAELDRALAVGAQYLLVNNRDLTSFRVDMETTTRLLARVPATIKVITASGIRAPEEVKQLPGRVDGALIGTALMRSEDPEKFLRACR